MAMSFESTVMTASAVDGITLWRVPPEIEAILKDGSLKPVEAREVLDYVEALAQEKENGEGGTHL